MIDWQRIRELKEEVGAEDFEEIATLFLQEVDGAMTQLDPDANAQKMAEDLHFLKGGALNLGFEALSDLCQAGERAALEGRLQDVDIAEVKRIYAASRADFLAQSGTTPP